MHPIGIPLLISVIWGCLMVFVWKSLPAERRGTKSIVAVAGGLTCLMIYHVGYVILSTLDQENKAVAVLERFHAAPVEDKTKTKTEVEAQEPAVREITIRVTEAGSLALNGRPLNDASLETELMKVAGDDPKPVIVISADERASYERVTEVLNLLAKARFENVAFEVPEHE